MTEEWVVDVISGIFVIIVCVFLSLNHLLVSGLLVLQRNLSQESTSERQLRYEHKMGVQAYVGASHMKKNILGATMGFSLGLEHLESTNEGRQYFQDVYDSGESGP